jgi:hypothetical protein
MLRSPLSRPRIGELIIQRDPLRRALDSLAALRRGARLPRALAEKPAALGPTVTAVSSSSATSTTRVWESRGPMDASLEDGRSLPN